MTERAASPAGCAAAFFDMDGTLLESNIVRFYLWYVDDGLRGLPRLARKSRLYASVPLFLLVDRFSRTALNNFFYRSYRGVSVDHFAEWNREAFERITRPRIFPAAVEEIRRLREQRARVVLVTGATREVAEPIAAFLGVDHVIPCELEIDAGRYTGRMLGPPIGDEEKARQVRRYAEREGIDLAASAAYGDNFADIPMLEATGHPIAVNPDRRLARAARSRGWPVKEWGKANGAGHS